MASFYERTLANMRESSILGPLVRWGETHPRILAWIVLGAGMVILLVVEARSVGLLPGQWAALIVATILVAGACIWIITWEDEEEMEEAESEG